MPNLDELRENVRHIQILQNQNAKKREELITMERRQRGYKNPEGRMIEGKTFILPKSRAWLFMDHGVMHSM